MSQISVFFDSAQLRLIEDSISTLVTGQDWDSATINNVFIEPAGYTAMLLPAVLDGANWTSLTTGVYTKFRLSDYVFLVDSSNWEEHSPDAGGPFIRYKIANDPMAHSALSGGLPIANINQAMVVEYYAGQDTNSARGVFECGWSTNPAASFGSGPGDVGLRFFDDGKTQVWKSGLQVGEGSISEKKELLEAILGNQAQNAKSRFITLLLIPMRDRELLICSTQGGAFIHTFEDLDESAGQTIVPANYFWFNVPPPVSAQALRIAKLQYIGPSGTVYGRPSSYRLPTPGGQSVQTHIYQSATEGALNLVALTTGAPVWNPYTATPITNAVQLKFVLTKGAGGQSPFLYAGRAWYDPQTGTTPASSVDSVKKGHIKKVSAEFGGIHGGHRIHLTLTRPAGMFTDGIPKITQTVNRPVDVSAGSEKIFQGVARTPKTEDRYSWLDNDSAQRVDIELNSVWEFAEKYRFGDPIPLDGYSLGDAYRLLCKTMGLATPTVSTGANSVILGNTGGKHGSDGFNLMVEVGDSGADWLLRLHETFAANWYHDIVYSTGSPVLTLQDPADLPSSVAVTLYPSAVAAAAALSIPLIEATKFVYTKHRRDWLEPEANDVWVMGMDYRTGRPILVHKRDSASIDPTTAPNSRPANWLGMLVKYSWVDPALSSYALLNYAMARIYPRVTTKRELHEFECQRLPNIKSGDLVKLKDTLFGDVTVRIKTFGFDVITAPDPALARNAGAYNHEPAHYVGEAGSLVCPLMVGGANLHEIKLNHEMKAYTNHTVLQTKLSEKVMKRPPIFATEV